ncbi:hypothetical protein BN14_05277 [Rhizoctonia solani AG-1 IB]|uniref:Uncharacterized protein n=1 Tax=Thanatephorus cucumeris (strain AG1-IB / isolate 7/3/14) TaxID=1108050 RepID=M5BVM3_THACB|nr:hypothetical protein BN14_05277 [Rhizoctonia solani AG-1 IB]
MVSIFAIANLASFSSLDNLAQLGLNFILGTFYILTLLTTLNARPYDAPVLAAYNFGDGQTACDQAAGVNTIRSTEQDGPLPMTKLGTSSAERSETSVDLKEAHVSGIQPEFHRIEFSGTEGNRNEVKDNEEENDELESIDVRVDSAKLKEPNSPC